LTEPTKYWLINDVVSHFTPGYIYGSAGTEVIILHDHLDIMIVVDAAGNIFHSRTDNLTNEKPDIGPPLKTETVQPAKATLNRKKKSSPITQKNLF
jgi:hypothetical protein